MAMDTMATHPYTIMQSIVGNGIAPAGGYKLADEFVKQIREESERRVLAKLIKAAFGGNTEKFEPFASKVAMLSPKIIFSENEAQRLLMLIWQTSKDTYDGKIVNLVDEVNRVR